MVRIFKGTSQTIVCTCKKTKAGMFQLLVAPYLSVQETQFYLASRLHLRFLSFKKEDLVKHAAAVSFVHF